MRFVYCGAIVHDLAACALGLLICFFPYSSCIHSSRRSPPFLLLLSAILNCSLFPPPLPHSSISHDQTSIHSLKAAVTQLEDQLIKVGRRRGGGKKEEYKQWNVGGCWIDCVSEE